MMMNGNSFLGKRKSQRVEKIFGAPGCGKTTTLLDIMERELTTGVAPERMAYLTFTRNARREAITRVKKRFAAKLAGSASNGGSDDILPFFRTLHSIAYRQLGTVASGMVRDEELAEFSELSGEFFSRQKRSIIDDGLPVFSGAHRGDQLLAFDHLRRQRCETVEQAYRTWPDSVRHDYQVVERFCTTYAEWKQAEALTDFTDLLQLADEPLPIDVAFVDEAQDLSRRQWEVLGVFTRYAQRVYIAGDDDQAIFVWAGADPTAFIQQPGNVRVLDRSYRMSRRVFGVAQHLTRRISNRQKKELLPRDESGDVSLVMRFDDVTIDAKRDTLILYRNHYLGRVVEERLLRDGIPFSRADGRKTPGAQWGPAIFWWERLRNGHALSDVQLRTVITAMVADGRTLTRSGRELTRRLRSDVTLPMVVGRIFKTVDEPWFNALDRIPTAEAEYLRRIVKHYGGRALIDPPAVKLSTIHAAKGAEADRVILLTGMSRKVRNALQSDPDNELRVFYVGATRARDELVLVGADNPLLGPASLLAIRYE